MAQLRFLITIFLLALPVTICAQTSNQPASTATNVPELRAISTNKLATFEKELGELANQGFRLERLLESVTVLYQAAILSRQHTTDSSPRYEYKLLTTRRTSTLQNELAEVANEGYEVRGILSSGKPYIGSEMILILERTVNTILKKFQYRVLSASLGKEKKLQEEIQKTVSDGFRPLKVMRHLDLGFGGFIGAGGSLLLAIVAKPEGNQLATTDEPEYLVLDASRISTMEKELNHAAKDGYNFLLSSPIGMVLLVRDRKTSELRYEYKLLEMKKHAEESALVTQSEQGFVYRATFSGTGGMAAVLEHKIQTGTDNVKRNYKIISFPSTDERKEKFLTEVSEAIAAGFRFLDITSAQRLNVIMVR